MCLTTTDREQTHDPKDTERICYLPKKVPSTSVTHPLQSCDLKHPSKDDFLWTLSYCHYITIQLALVYNVPLEREFILSFPWIHRQ